MPSNSRTVIINTPNNELAISFFPNQAVVRGMIATIVSQAVPCGNGFF
jgi:hypothetical protein